MLYPQNGDRNVAIDTVTSIHPMHAILINVRSKADMSQLNLPHGTDN